MSTEGKERMDGPMVVKPSGPRSWIPTILLGAMAIACVIGFRVAGGVRFGTLAALGTVGTPLAVYNRTWPRFVVTSDHLEYRRHRRSKVLTIAEIEVIELNQTGIWIFGATASLLHADRGGLSLDDIDRLGQLIDRTVDRQWPPRRPAKS